MSIKYLTKTETAKIIRQALKAEFPTVTFSVSCSRGSVVNVRWTDGPSTKMVERITGRFSGASFDGMTDLKSYHDSIHNGELVHFGADWVFCSRSYSLTTWRTLGERIARSYGATMPEEMAPTSYVEGPILNEYANLSLRDMLWRELAETAVTADGGLVKVTLKYRSEAA